MSDTIVRDGSDIIDTESKGERIQRRKERIQTKRDRIVDEYLTGSFERASQDVEGMRKASHYYGEYHLRIDAQKPDTRRGLLKKFLFSALGVNANRFPGDVRLFDVIGNKAFQEFRDKLPENDLTFTRLSIHNSERTKDTIWGQKTEPRTVISISVRSTQKLGF